MGYKIKFFPSAWKNKFDLEAIFCEDYHATETARPRRFQQYVVAMCCQIRCGYVLSNMCSSERHRMIFYPGKSQKNLDKFLVLAVAKSVSDLPLTVFLCSDICLQLKWICCLPVAVWTTSCDCLLLNTDLLQTSVHVVYLFPINQNLELNIMCSSRFIYLIFED